MFLRRSFSLVLLLIMSVAPGAKAQDAATDVTLFLTFVPNIQFAPVYVAIESGYFADEGLIITLQHGDEPDGVTLIAADQLKFGIISGEQVIQSRAMEFPVVFVYEWFQQYPVGVVTSAASGIETVADLAGRKVGIPGPFGASYTGLIALLSSADLTVDDILMESIGFNAPEVVCVGGVEAAVVYINNEPLQIQQRADAGDCGPIESLLVMPVASAVDMVSNGIVTNQMTLDEDPALVQAVVNGFDAGLRAAIHNPARAYLLSATHVEGLLTNDTTAFRVALEAEAAAQDEFLSMEPDAAAIRQSRVEMRARLADQFDAPFLVQFDVLLNTIALWEAEQLGWSDPESWELTQDVLIEAGILDAALDLSGAFSNAFVEG